MLLVLQELICDIISTFCTDFKYEIAFCYIRVSSDKNLRFYVTFLRTCLLTQLKVRNHVLSSASLLLVICPDTSVSARTVSYTHLDVYKRQVVNNLIRSVETQRNRKAVTLKFVMNS